MTLLPTLLLLLVCTASGAKEGKANACADPFQLVDGLCYYFANNVSLTWWEARELCQNLDSDLAVIHTCEHFAHTVRTIHMSALEVPPGEYYWIGGSDQGDEGAWYYVDGLPMSMGVPFWGETNSTYEPDGGTDQNCACLMRDDRYYIHDTQCDNPGYPICQHFNLTQS